MDKTSLNQLTDFAHRLGYEEALRDVMLWLVKNQIVTSEESRAELYALKPHATTP